MITISSQTFGGVYMKYGKRLLALVLAASLFAEPTLPAQASARSSKTSHKASTAATVKRIRILRVKKKKLRALIRRSIQQQEMIVLKKQILSYLSDNGLSSANWSIYVKNLKTNQSISTCSRSFTAASTIKLFAMAAAYDKIERKQLTMTSDLSTKLWNMIVYSDNDSFNSIVADYVGPAEMNQFLKRQKFTRTAQYHGIGPGSHPYLSSTRVNGVNHTSAADCGMLLEKIYRGTMASKSASDAMLSLLKQQTYRYKIPAGVPSGVTVANKTGEFEQFQHDAAIVYGQKTPYVICIFSEDSNANSISHIRRLSSMAYQYLNG